MNEGVKEGRRRLPDREEMGGRQSLGRMHARGRDVCQDEGRTSGAQLVPCSLTQRLLILQQFKGCCHIE